MKKILSSVIVLVVAVTIFSCRDRMTIMNNLETEIDTIRLNFEFAKFDNALNKAKFDNKHILVYVTSDGCAPCIKMERNVFSDSSVQQYYNGNFICSKIYIKRTASVMKSSEFKKLNKTQIDFLNYYNIDLAYPTFLILDNEGTLIKKAEGYMEIDDFIQFGDSAIQ
ncbi:MAG TPA: thioredoxin family protein [Cyclobacteriaceae bacterium]|nr:thioredoxin family protein [Cyclobacteriaceae bacterium]